MEELVNPNIAMYVFILLIHNAINERQNPYEATRYSWSVSQNNRNLQPAFAVGIINNISVTSYEIQTWQISEANQNAWEFTSLTHPNPEFFEPLLNLSWRNIIAQAQAYWRFGNYLITEFDGNGRFRIIRGAPQNRNWHNCI